MKATYVINYKEVIDYAKANEMEESVLPTRK